jgi:hypothetical protein
MRESRSYGSVGEREGNDPLYPEGIFWDSDMYANTIILLSFGLNTSDG